MSPKRILITGAAGFIGYHLSCYLKKRGDEIVGIDNFNDYYSNRLKRDRAEQLRNLGVEIVEGDIADTGLLEALVIKDKITHIAHLAAQAGVRYSIDNPSAYVTENISGFLNILELCRRHPHIFLTYASSSSVYGTNTKIPFSIDDPTDHQASFYGVTKKTNELMAYTYHHLYAIPVTGLRFFTVYGPWGRPDMAYFSFTKAILEGKTIDVFNYGQMQRDFTYIDDIIEGTAAAIDLQSPLELFNLGNNTPEPLSGLIEAIESELGIKAKTRQLPMQPGDVVSTFADSGHSREKLGFHPKVSLKDGIAKFVRWYKEYYKQ
jgi:UDP-glucuronate 4-epimerase